MRKLFTVCVLASLPVLYGCVAAAIGGAAAGGYLIGEDRRTSSIMGSDERIEVTIKNRVSDQHPKAHVSPVSYNRVVLLNGAAPTEADKAAIEKLVRGVEGVREIYNEMTVGPVRSDASIAGDAILTGKVKARMVDSRKFNPVHVKVVSEDGTVYLMGIVKRPEADAATEVARTTSGVKRVVRMFEYQN